MSTDNNDGQSNPTHRQHSDFQQHSDSDFSPAVGHLSDESSSRIAVIPDSLSSELPISSPATVHSALEFRVIRPGAPVRRLRLTGNRYTFGSGEGCSIRLDDESLRPMHAVLLRDAHRILMRAYSVPLECNGSRVTESVLRLGDIIRMGNYRFELLSAPTSADTRRSDGRPASGSNSRQSPLTDTRESHLRDRITELSQQWHARHAECEIRESRCDLRESELHGRETELWSRAERLQQRENLLVAQEAAAREIQETYAATQHELKELRAREVEAGEALKEKEAELLHKSELLEQRQAELERRKAEWKEREAQFAEQSAEAQRKLEQTQQQAQSANDAVGRMREEFSALSEQLTELRERHSELQVRERQEREEHERLCAELEASRDQTIAALAESEASRDQTIEALAESEAKRGETESELKRVAADLQSTRDELARIRAESKQCQNELSEKLRATGEELQATRQAAEQSRRASEEEHAYSEKRIGELEERLAEVQENREESELASQEEIAELKRKHEAAEKARTDAENTASELRTSLGQLQESVAQATQEASRLRMDYEGANASIRQLELLVDQTKNNQSAQQESWTQESDQLRQTIEELSIQLSAANVELGQLRSANEALSDELARAQDDAAEQQTTSEQAALDSEQFCLLEEELDSARREIERLQNAHAETVSRLESERQESESALRQEIELLREEIASAQQVTEAKIQEIIQSERDRNTEAVAESSTVTDVDQVTQEEFETEENGAESLEASAGSAPHTDQFVQSGENVWRLESEQAVEQSSHLADDHIQVDDGDGEPEFQASSLWDQSEYLSDAAADPDTSDASSPESPELQDQDDEGVTWQDELPEDAVADAIDDIEHNVEQAIADFDSSAESTSSESDIEEPVADEQPAAQISDMEVVRQFATQSDDEQDTPLDWSAYMPGGAIDTSVDDEAEVSQESVSSWDQTEFHSEQPSLEDELEDEDANRQEPTSVVDEEADLESSSWGDLRWGNEPGGDSQISEPESSGLEHSDQEYSGLEHREPEQCEPESEDPEEFQPTQQWDSDPAEAAGKGLSDDEHFDEHASDPYASDERWSGEEALSSESEASTGYESEDDEPELATGSLAAMLIRDLAGDQDEQFDDAATADSEYSATDGDEDSNAEATFVMESELGFSDDESDDEFQSWNFSSPDPVDEQPSDDADAYRADAFEHQTEEVGVNDSDADLSDDYESEEHSVSQTAVASAPETVIVADEAPEDDSIEAYMSRLLQRVQGEKPAPAGATGAPKKQAEPEPAAEAEVATQDDEVEDSTEVELQQQPAAVDTTPLVPRSQAPELSRNLSAMRELANQSARNAVSRSIRIQARDTQMKAALKGGLAFTFVMMAIGVFIFVTWSTTIKIAMVGAFLVLAGVFGQEAFVLVRDARRRLALAEHKCDDFKDDEEIAEEMQRIADETHIE